MSIKGKLAIVTGASSGIGKAAAASLSRRGADLILLARSNERLAQAAEEIEGNGRRVHFFPVDLSLPEEVANVANKIRSEAGVPDLIINNAGSGRWLAAANTAIEEYRSMIEVPYLAAAYLTRAFLPNMVQRRSGQIAFVASPASWLVWPNAAGYIAARHALKGFAEALRTEVEPKGIGVSLITLGTVSSPYWEHNPGSREHLPTPIPFLMPELTIKQAGETVANAVERNKKYAFKPGVFRILAALNGLLPTNFVR